MKYLTKEELMDIANKLLENPTRETLKMLSNKYSNEIKEDNIVTPNVSEIGEVESIPVIQTPPAAVEENNNLIEKIESPVVIPAVDMQNNTVSPIEEQPVAIPNFVMPELDVPTFVNQNNESVNFNGNIFDTPSPTVGNLMQTTDNFNSVPNTMPSTEVPLTPTPFFSAQQELVNNPIPVSVPVNNMVNQGPSMFGQFEQNYS